MAEQKRFFLRTKQVKRTQRIMQAVGESALPEVLASLRNELFRSPRVVTHAEGNTRSSVNGKDVKGRRSYQAVACMKRCIQELGRPI